MEKIWRDVPAYKNENFLHLLSICASPLRRNQISDSLAPRGELKRRFCGTRLGLDRKIKDTLGFWAKLSLLPSARGTLKLKEPLRLRSEYEKMREATLMNSSRRHADAL